MTDMTDTFLIGLLLVCQFFLDLFEGFAGRLGQFDGEDQAAQGPDGHAARRCSGPFRFPPADIF